MLARLRPARIRASPLPLRRMQMEMACGSATRHCGASACRLAIRALRSGSPISRNG